MTIIRNPQGNEFHDLRCKCERCEAAKQAAADAKRKAETQ